MSADGLRDDAWKPTPPTPNEDEEEDSEHQKTKKGKIIEASLAKYIKDDDNFRKHVVWGSEDENPIFIAEAGKKSHSGNKHGDDSLDEGSEASNDLVPDREGKHSNSFQFDTEFEREAQKAVLGPLFKSISGVGALISGLFMIVFLISGAYLLSIVFAVGLLFTIYSYRTGY